MMEKEEISPLATDIIPGKECAVLEMADGRKVELGLGKNLGQLQLEGTVVTNDSNRLAYKQNHSGNPSTLEYNTIIIPRGGEYQLILSDGSRVWLNSDTRLRYPVSFIGEKREVYLEGEAYFEVHHDPSCPFYVKTASLDVKVLGTSFNVKAYDDMDVVETSLVEGVVSVKDNVLRPNMQAVFDKNTGNFSYREINGDNYRLRKERVFVFENERLDDILQEMARWYDFDIFYQNSDMADKQFGLKLEKYEHVDSLLKMLELTGEVKFSMKGRILTVMSGSE